MLCGQVGSSRRSGDRPAGESRRGAFGAYGTVLIVPLGDLPDWLPAWCLDHLGGEPSDVLFQLQQISMAFGLRLAGDTDMLVKARPDDGRAVSCVAAQARLAERGFPVPGRSRRWPVSVRWPCMRKSSGPAARCCKGTRRTWPRATRRCSPG